MKRVCTDVNGPPRRFAAMLLCACVACAAFPAHASADEGAAAEAPVKPRPRIGLVLGGGGAKGAAHVGVLDVLDELRIPVDCIVGTSMGALVGGTYASGMSADELETAVRSISWQETIARSGLRGQVPMRRKLAGNTYSNSLEFGVRDGRLIAPSGFINTQNVDLTIQYLVGRSRGITEFDQLPIPFRAVATDMQTGEMVVLDRGDLALAMRASMAVPGVFSPVSIDGRILGDGGLTRNVPVDIARQTCADVVIAVAVPNPPPTADDLRSPLTMMTRTLDVLVGANERQQLDTLGPADVKIVIEMGDIGSASFDRIDDAIPKGRAAALAHRADLDAVFGDRGRVPGLAGNGVPAREGQGHAGGREPASVSSGRIRNSSGRRSACRPETWSTARQIAQRVNAVFALSDFERVAYTLSGDPGQSTLDVHLLEKSWGPHIVRFDLGLYVGTDEDAAFTIGADYLQTWVNDRGGELARIGATGPNLGPGGLLLPATRRGASLVRRAGPGCAAIPRGPLRRRRRGDQLSVLFCMGLPRRGTRLWQASRAACGRPLRRPVGHPGNRLPGPARHPGRGLWRPLDALHLRLARPRRALAARHGRPHDLFPQRGSAWSRGALRPFRGHGNRRAAAGSQRRLPAGERRVVVRYRAALVRHVQSWRPGQLARAQHRGTARDRRTGARRRPTCGGSRTSATSSASRSSRD